VLDTGHRKMSDLLALGDASGFYIELEDQGDIIAHDTLAKP
jgi:hypothetical protein